MDLILLQSGDKPYYEQIYDQLASQIVNHELEANFCLPSIRVVAKELNISIITVKKAWEILEENGLIYTRAGLGCFVSEVESSLLKDKKLDMAVEKLSTQLNYYKSLGLSYEELIKIIKDIY